MLIKLKIVMNKMNKFKPLPQGARELSVVESQQVAGGLWTRVGKWIGSTAAGEAVTQGAYSAYGHASHFLSTLNGRIWHYHYRRR